LTEVFFFLFGVVYALAALGAGFFIPGKSGPAAGTTPAAVLVRQPLREADRFQVVEAFQDDRMMRIFIVVEGDYLGAGIFGAFKAEFDGFGLGAVFNDALPAKDRDPAAFATAAFQLSDRPVPFLGQAFQGLVFVRGHDHAGIAI